MAIWALCTAVLATAISMVFLTHIAVRWHDKHAPRTLSEVAADQEQLLWHFRKVLWLCGSLFAVAVYGFLVPRVGHGWLLFGAWTVTYLGNLLLAVVPARGKTFWAHHILAQSMATGMLAMAFLFWVNLHGWYVAVEGCVAVVMSLMAALTFLDKARYIIYELAFLYLSHFSIVIAVLALIHNL